MTTDRRVIYVPDDQWAQLREEAWERRTTVSALVRARLVLEDSTPIPTAPVKAEVLEVSGHAVTIPPELWARWCRYFDPKDPDEAVPVLLTQFLDAKKAT